jgi:hypothetical protein
VILKLRLKLGMLVDKKKVAAINSLSAIDCQQVSWPINQLLIRPIILLVLSTNCW